MWNRIPKALWWGILGVACVLILGFVALVLFLKPPSDEVRFFQERRQALSSHHIEFLQRDRRAIRYSIELRGEEGLVANGFLRLPISNKAQLPAIILLGGLRTGKDTMWLLDDLPESNDYVCITLDYPYDGPMQMSTFEFLGRLPGIRESVWNGVAAMLLSYDFLRNYSVVDTQQIIFVGVSLGSFFVLPAAQLASPTTLVALHFGGADIEELAYVSLRNRGRLWPVARIMSALVAFGLQPLEPTRWAVRNGNRSVLLVNGKKDQRIPVTCVDKLVDAFPNRPTIYWLEEDHVLRSSRDLILELVALTDKWVKANQDSVPAVADL